MRLPTFLFRVVLLGSFLTASALAQTNPIEVTNINEFPGYNVQNGEYEMLNTVISGHYLFTSYKTSCFVYDISNPSNTTRVGTYLPSANYQIVSGGLLFQVQDSTWDVVNIENPASPNVLFQSDTQTVQWEAVATYGHYAFLTDFKNGLSAFDISNPRSPSLLYQTNTPIQPVGIIISGHYAYVSTFGNGLCTFDISNPTTAMQTGQVVTGGASLSGYQMVIRGSYL